MSYILGLNAYHGNPRANLLKKVGYVLTKRPKYFMSQPYDQYVQAGRQSY